MSSATGQAMGRPQLSPFDPEEWQTSFQTLPGQAVITAGSLGAEVMRQTVSLQPGENTLMLDVSRHPGLRGVVVDENGDGLAGVSVVLTPFLENTVTPLGADLAVAASGAARSSSTIETWSNVEGQYLFPLLPPDRLYGLSFRLSGYGSEQLAPVGIRGDHVEAVAALTMGQGRSVSGLVVDEIGLPVSGCEVRVAVSGGAIVSTRTNREGAFRWTGLARGPLRIWTQDELSVNAGQHVDDPGDVEVKLVLQAGVWVDGTLRYRGGGAASGLLLFGFVDEAGDGSRVGERLARPRQVLTAGDGSFRLGPFAPGPVRLVEPATTYFETRLMAPSTVDLEIPGLLEWTARLRFVDALSGHAVTSAGEGALSWGGSGLKGGEKGLSVLPDEDGKWTLSRESPDALSVELAVGFPGYELARIQDIARGALGESALEVQLQRVPLLTVAVRDASGEPVAGATVVLSWVAIGTARERDLVAASDEFLPPRVPTGRASGTLEARRTTDADGAARFVPLENGEVRCYVSAPGYFPGGGRYPVFSTSVTDRGEGEPEPAFVVTLERVRPVAALR